MEEKTALKKKTSKPILHELYDWAESMLSAIILVIVILTFIIRGTVVDGDSMLPTLEDNQFLMLSRVYGNMLNYNDIVVVYAQNLAAGDGTGNYGKPIIKRVIGLAGDEVYVCRESGEAFRNPLNQNGLSVTDKYTVPANHIFVLGDNRGNSMDSRHSNVGMIDNNYIIGRVIFRVTPFELFGSVK